MAFTVGELERLEEIVCPECEGMMLVDLGPVVVEVGLDRLKGLVNGMDFCDVCNGEGHVWRVGGGFHGLRDPATRRVATHRTATHRSHTT